MTATSARNTLINSSNRVLRYLTRHAVVSGLVRLESRPAVLALVILSSRGNVAGQMVARGALTSSRVRRRSFCAAVAPGSLSVLIFPASAGYADGVASLVGVEPLCALSARSGASICQLVAPNRAVGARCLSGGRSGFPGRAIGANDRPTATRVMAR